MTEERPDDAREPDGTGRPADGDDGLEARRAPGTDAPFHGLRSAADIFGAPRTADEWPSRRERREAEKAARATGAPLPEPFDPVASAPEAPSVSEVPPVSGSSSVSGSPSVAPEPPAPLVPATAPVLDDGATQAISMPEQLAQPTEHPQADAEHERETLSDRIPPAAPVPPAPTAPHPSSITLPTAMTHRDQRAAENRAIEDERRRLDPFGQGRSDVDWLGRATGSQPVPTGPVAQQPVGVENVLPTSDQPPSFTELLRITDAPDAQDPPAALPFDWAIHDDEVREVPATLTSDSFDTTTGPAAYWSLADDADDDVVAGETAPADHDPAADAHPPVVAPSAPVVPPVVQAAAAVPVVLPDATPVPDTTEQLDTTDVAEASRASDASAEPEPEPEPEPDAPTTAMPVAATPWWAEPDATVPPTAAPPLVEPTGAGQAQYPAHLPPAVGQDLDAVMGLRGHQDEPASLPAAAPEDLDQSEWDGRETSDTSAIKDLFGTQAVDQLAGAGYDPHDTGTRMMPAAAVPPAHAPAPGRTPVAPAPVAGDGSGDRGNFINEGFARLRNEGRRGKLLLIWGAVAVIVVLLVLVFALTQWILGNTIEEHTPAPTKSAAAASAPASPAPSTPAAAPQAPSTALATLQFATTPAAPGVHGWTELAGGECLSPFANAWAQTYTVVDCAAPHLAQLTARLQVTGDQWPGTQALAAQAAERCQASEALNASAAAAYGDVQVQGSYAPDQGTWDQGDRFISCFVTRSSGQTLTGSLAPSA